MSKYIPFFQRNKEIFSLSCLELIKSKLKWNNYNAIISNKRTMCFYFFLKNAIVIMRLAIKLVLQNIKHLKYDSLSVFLSLRKKAQNNNKKKK